jgi:hypothetical protein
VDGVGTGNGIGRRILVDEADAAAVVLLTQLQHNSPCIVLLTVALEVQPSMTIHL